MSYIQWQSHTGKPMYPSLFLQELAPHLYSEIR
jgi:hypothetical protein